MSFRRALLSLAFCTTAPAAASAQAAEPAPRMVELAYEITFAGFAGFRLNVAARLDGQAYDIESHAFKEGVLRALTIHYVGRNRAWGTVAPDGARPIGGSLSIVVGDKPRTWLAQYGAAGSVQETHNPEWKPIAAHQISDEQRRSALDPLTAVLTVGFASDNACDRTIPSFDGKRRIDVVLKKVGSEPAAATGVPGVQGDALVCELHTHRVAGEFDEAPKEAETEKQRPMKIWLARLDSSQLRLPVKLEAQTGFGTIRGKTLTYSQRSLTDEERVAMRR